MPNAAVCSVLEHQNGQAAAEKRTYNESGAVSDAVKQSLHGKQSQGSMALKQLPTGLNRRSINYCLFTELLVDLFVEVLILNLALGNENILLSYTNNKYV